MAAQSTAVPTFGSFLSKLSQEQLSQLVAEAKAMRTPRNGIPTIVEKMSEIGVAGKVNVMQYIDPQYHRLQFGIQVGAHHQPHRKQKSKRSINCFLAFRSESFSISCEFH